MNIKDELSKAKELVKSGHTEDMLINYLADRKIYHSLAILIFSSTFDKNHEISRARIYEHDYYSKFENEKNPFNEDFFNLLNENDNE